HEAAEQAHPRHQDRRAEPFRRDRARAHARHGEGDGRGALADHRARRDLPGPDRGRRVRRAHHPGRGNAGEARRDERPPGAVRDRRAPTDGPDRAGQARPAAGPTARGTYGPGRMTMADDATPRPAPRNAAENRSAKVLALVTPDLEPGESVIAVLPGAQTGPSPWLTAMLPFMMYLLAKGYAVVVTDRRVLFVRCSSWSGQPRSLETVYAR